MQRLIDHIPGDVITIDSHDTRQGLIRHTVLFTDNTTGTDTVGVWEETQQEYTAGWGYTEKTTCFTLFERVR